MTHPIITTIQLIILITVWVMVIRPVFRKAFGPSLPKRRPKL